MVVGEALGYGGYDNGLASPLSRRRRRLARPHAVLHPHVELIRRGPASSSVV